MSKRREDREVYNDCIANIIMSQRFYESRNYDFDESDPKSVPGDDDSDEDCKQNPSCQDHC